MPEPAPAPAAPPPRSPKSTVILEADAVAAQAAATPPPSEIVGDADAPVEDTSPSFFNQPSAIGKYKIVGVIGRGSMGIVYKAYQEDLKRTTALKVLLEGAHASETQRRHFIREAQAIAQLRHPNIVTVYEVGEHENCPFIVIDFIEGATLDRYIDKGTLTPQLAAHYCLQIAEAVHYAHGKGIIHRDLKPANIILDPEGRPIITDFGLARNMSESLMTFTGDIVGTPAYMAPEQARGKSHLVDARSDVYAIGAILFHMLAGRSPFAGKSLLETLTALLHEQGCGPLLGVQPDADPTLAAVCDRALQYDPDQRYQTAREMAEALRQYLYQVAAGPAAAPAAET